MACRNLQEFIKALEQKGELCRIKDTVEIDLELADITAQVSLNNGPALLFETPGDHQVPVLANALGSIERICIALGVKHIEDAAKRVKDLLLDAEPANAVSTEKTDGGDTASRLHTPHCREITLEGNDVDLSMLPIPRCWPLDAGPAITLPVIFTKDPETGSPNAGLYRMQVFDRQTTGMHWYRGSGGAKHYEKARIQARPLPVAVAIGPAPAVTLAACAPLPENLYEIKFAQALSHSPVEMIPCLHSDLSVPASSQIILEGIVDPNFQKTEGPFGNHTGYYSRPEEFPVFHITCMSMRKDAVFPATVPGPPPQEDCFMAKAVERLFLPVIKTRLPEIVDINFPVEGIFNRIVFVSIVKQYPGHAEKIIKDLWNMGRGIFSKIIWVFDSSVNVQDLPQVLWKMSNCLNPCMDIITVTAGSDVLDPAAVPGTTGCRMGLDCTEKWPEERDGTPWPQGMTMKKSVRGKTIALLEKAGLSSRN